jgi:hypothetical protein
MDNLPVFARPCFLLAVISAAIVLRASAQTNPRVQLTLDSSEARQVLVILHKEQAHQPVNEHDWRALFATAPYQWLKARESSMHRDFTDEDFRKFLESPESIARLPEWEQSLAGMERADMTALGAHVLEWLPPEAVIHARVFPEIKPKTNSFVWRNENAEAAIFLYIEKQSQAEFENTVAHECHHIGLASLDAQQQKLTAGLPANVREAVEWLGAFGEGDAMLAAAGSADLHPHWDEDAAARARWDSDMMHFNQDLAALVQFFDEILDGKLKGDDARQKAQAFYGDQGPWYTVGYEMAALVEKQYGRKVFTDCLLDPRLLLIRYNKIAELANQNGASLSLWPSELLVRLGSGQIGD